MGCKAWSTSSLRSSDPNLASIKTRYKDKMVPGNISLDDKQITRYTGAALFTLTNFSSPTSPAAKLSSDAGCWVMCATSEHQVRHSWPDPPKKNGLTV